MGQLAEVVLDDQERETLERWARRPKSSQALALRCRIVLAAAEGHASKEIAADLGCNHNTVSKWRGRFARRRLDGLHDGPRPGKPRSISDEDVERVIVKTLEEQPTDATHWSTRSMAAATGMSQSAVSRIWRAFALKPHQVESFKLSPDPQFIDKVRDVVGIYLNPPEAAVVLCVDEKSQIQALDRSAPVLPLMPGVPARQTHDYVRNGTTNLYAALDVASGQVISEMTPRLQVKRASNSDRSDEGRGLPGDPSRGLPGAAPGSTSDRRELPSAKGGIYWAMHQGALRPLAQATIPHPERCAILHDHQESRELSMEVSMIAHVATFEGTAEQLDEAIRLIREEVDPQNIRKPGYIEGLFLVDRDAGSGLLIGLWENEPAIESAEERSTAEGRTGALEATGGRRTSVRRYEVASLVRGHS